MKKTILIQLFLSSLVSICAGTALAQGLDSAGLLQPLENEWLSYSGDYTGQRYSRLDKVNKDNVQHLTLAWTGRMNSNIRTRGAVVTRRRT